MLHGWSGAKQAASGRLGVWEPAGPAVVQDPSLRPRWQKPRGVPTENEAIRAQRGAPAPNRREPRRTPSLVPAQTGARRLHDGDIHRRRRELHRRHGNADDVADLGGLNLFSWVFAVYLLTQAVSIPVYGRLSDIYGRKKVFFVGAGMFLVGSTLCGFAGNMLTLILFRTLQGFGAGGVQPVATTILGDVYSPAERAHVQGLVSSVFGVAAIAGPSLGAFLVENVGLAGWCSGSTCRSDSGDDHDRDVAG